MYAISLGKHWSSILRLWKFLKIFTSEQSLACYTLCLVMCFFTFIIMKGIDCNNNVKFVCSSRRLCLMKMFILVCIAFNVGVWACGAIAGTLHSDFLPFLMFYDTFTPFFPHLNSNYFIYTLWCQSLWNLWLCRVHETI